MIWYFFAIFSKPGGPGSRKEMFMVTLFSSGTDAGDAWWVKPFIADKPSP